jgi:hypothetical protein
MSKPRSASSESSREEVDAAVVVGDELGVGLEDMRESRGR